MFHIEKAYLDWGKIGRGREIALCDTEMPTFSWAIHSAENDDHQTACRVIVSDDRDALFDSGWVMQAEQSLKYTGNRLPHGKMLTLTISVQNRHGVISQPFITRFTCGLLDEDERMGAWISSGEATEGRVLYFRRDISLNRKPVSACLYASGLGYHHITVNGQPVTDAKLEPAHSNYTRLVYYTVHPDVAQLLREGENALGIAVAEGWRNNKTDFAMWEVGRHDREVAFFGRSQLWAQLVLTYADGTTEIIATDESWGVKYSAITEASIFNGETYDARCADPMWNQPGEARGFVPATLVPDPGGELRPMVLEPIREARTYQAIELCHPRPNVSIVDFGQNIAGVVRLRLPERMSCGQQIIIRLAEELDDDGNLSRETLRDAKATDTYIASGDERDLDFYCPTFTYHGFRYCEITGMDVVNKADVTAHLWCTDLKNGSFFRCGSPTINALQQAIVMTEMDNMHSILTDCPQRDERFAWMNDATVRFEETPYNFDIGRMFPKLIRDIRAEQRPEGQFTCTCPFYFGELPADPVCSAYLMAGYEAWQHTGNLDVLRDNFDGFAAWEAYLLSQSRDYIVEYSHYGDWAAPGYACEGGDEGARNLHTEGTLMSTGYSYLNCRLLSAFADALDDADKARHYADLAANIRAAILKRWYHDETATIGGGSHGEQAFALWLDILPEDKRQMAADHLARSLVESGYRFTSGNLCTRYMVDMLAKYGYIDVAWNFLNREEYPSYGYMLQNEATTIWERFEMKRLPGSMNSHNHPMYGAVGSFFYMWLMGVTPAVPGWRKVRIAPMIPEGLLSAQCVVDTVMGDIALRCTNRYGRRNLTLQIPFGMTAEVIFGGKSWELPSGHHALHADC